MQHAYGVDGSAARRSPISALSIGALFAALAAILLIAAPAASAKKKVLPGGVSARAGLEAEIPESTETETSEGESGEGVGTGEETVTGAKAQMIGSRAVAPASAPAVVKQVIAAANRIRTTPYIWGGGH